MLAHRFGHLSWWCIELNYVWTIMKRSHAMNRIVMMSTADYWVCVLNAYVKVTAITLIVTFIYVCLLMRLYNWKQREHARNWLTFRAYCSHCRRQRVSINIIFMFRKQCSYYPNLHLDVLVVGTEMKSSLTLAMHLLYSSLNVSGR